MCRYYAIYLFTFVLLISCGSPLQTRPEFKQAELDTAFYNKYIQKGPDTNLYPVFVYTSSQREPSEKFGFYALMDGSTDTWWSSNTGLNTGEYILMEVKNIPATTCKIFISNDMIVARIAMVSVYINDSLVGNFPSGAPIPLPKDFRKIKIVAGETDGLNEVKLPIINDSTSTIQVTKKNLITRYNSKPFGVSEIEFYDKNGKKLPMRMPPVRKATIQGAFIAAPEERFNMFDGNSGTAAYFVKADAEGKIIFIFPDFTPFTKLRIYNGPTDYLNYPASAEIGFEINGKKQQKYILQPGLNEINMTEPFVARTFTLYFHKFAPGSNIGGLGEIQGFDGARWYTIEPDSIYLRNTRLKDSVATTPLSTILNNQVSYAYDYTVLNTDTFKVINVNSIPQQYVDKRVFQKSTVIFRSNFTWEASTTGSTITYGKKVTLVDSQRKMYGDFKLASKNADQVVLNVRYKVTETITVDGKPSSTKTKVVSGKATITKTQLVIDGLVDMLISY